MAEENQNDKTIFSKIWNDTVWAGVISAVVFSGLSFVAQHFLFVKTCKEFFEIKIPIGIGISVAVGFVAMILFLVFRIRKSNKKIAKINSDFGKQNLEFENAEQNYKKEIETLKNKIAELEKKPEDKRLFEFSVGDTVTRKLDKENYNPKEYSVAEIDTKNGKVILRDENNKKEAFLPGELLTATETVQAEKKAADAMRKMFDLKRTCFGLI